MVLLAVDPVVVPLVVPLVVVLVTILVIDPVDAVFVNGPGPTLNTGGGLIEPDDAEAVNFVPSLFLPTSAVVRGELRFAGADAASPNKAVTAGVGVTISLSV